MAREPGELRWQDEVRWCALLLFVVVCDPFGTAQGFRLAFGGEVRPAGERLRAEIITAVGGGKKPMVFVEHLGRRMRGRLVAATEAGIRVEIGAGKPEIAWEDIAPEIFCRIGEKVLGGSPAVRDLLKRYRIEAGLEQERTEKARAVTPAILKPPAKEKPRRRKPRRRSSPFELAEAACRQPKPWPRHTAPPGTHPRVFFRREDVPFLRRKAQTPQGRDIVRHAILWRADQGWNENPKVRLAGADEHGLLWKNVPKKKNFRGKDEPKRVPLDFGRTAGDMLFAWATAHVLTGKEKYADKAKLFMHSYCTWPDWGDEEGEFGLTLAHITVGFAYAYDVLHETFSGEEKQKFKETLAKMARQNYVGATDPKERAWWARAFFQNHMWNHHAALGIAALALEGEHPDWKKWLDAARRGARYILMATGGISDGSWHESIGYRHYGLRTLMPFLYALRYVKGEDLIGKHSFFRRTYLFQTYHSTFDDRNSYLLTDGDHVGFSKAPMAWRFIARWYGDGRAEWQARWDSKGHGAHGWFGRRATWELIFFDPDIEPVAPNDLPLDLHASDWEGVVWRSGWDESAALFAMKCGPQGGRFASESYMRKSPPWDPAWRSRDGDPLSRGYNPLSVGHDHEDQGTFWIYRKGLYSSECYGYTDKQATKYHNTITIDGKGQKGAVHRGDVAQYAGETPVVRVSDGYNYAVADMTRCYDMSGISAIHRHVLWVKPLFFIIVDQCVAEAPHLWQWNIHFDEGFETEGQWLKGICGGNRRLGVQVLSPKKFRVEQVIHTAGTHPLTGRAFKVNVGQCARVSPAGPVAAVRFITLLWPTTEAEWGARAQAKIVSQDEHSIRLKAALPDGQTCKIRVVLGPNGAASVTR